ncbi:MAG: hypothetical protein JJT90_09625 [Ectothiorhodospiraceae bacterium]|nr:hypothetical protein [Ectothiorhodospiraceae bacterium]
MKTPVLIFLMALAPAAWADGMRTLEPIGGGREVPASSLPGVARDDVEDFVNALLEAWNGQGLERLLAEDFPDRNRLLGDLAELPPTARLRLLSIGPVQTLESSWEEDALVTLLSVRVRARVELEGEDGPRRHETTQELVIRFVRRLTD